ncbi:hypothetical protein SLE2022_047520 [Rubroshorea leprosula]
MAEHGVSSMTSKPVVLVDFEAEVSQRLIDALHHDDVKLALECLADRFVDVNFIGTVSLKVKKTEVVLREESAHEVRVEYEEFRTDVSPLFLAAHVGNVILVKKLLSLGANVNQKLFRGYATTAAVREGQMEVLEVLIKSGACQEACEEALMAASYLGYAGFVGQLMASDLIRPQVAVHALISASCRGFVDIVDTFTKCGVDVNATHRVLLRSLKPSLYTDVDCTALAAAVVNRHISVVKLLLEAEIKMDQKVKLGAWSWDIDTGEEFRVGAGLAEAYPITWSAVEYYEGSGAILQLLLQHLSPNALHGGRTVLHHAILCNNARAVEVLLNNGADVEFPISTTSKIGLRPVHLAARLGFANVLHCLIVANSNLNSQSATGETALMISARHKHEECFKALALKGADFGLVDSASQSVVSIAGLTKWTNGFRNAVLDLIRAGKIPQSSNSTVFSPLIFVTQANDLEALKKLIEKADTDLDERDVDGYSAAMVAVTCGNVEAFKLLLYAGADVKLRNSNGDTAISLSHSNPNSEAFDRIMLEYTLQEGNRLSGFHALHRAALRGDLNSLHILIKRGYDVNAFDGDGYTPLMLAASGGHGGACQVLISCGARCDLENGRHETALLLARKNSEGNVTEQVILDELARKLVVNGARVNKHTRGGKGKPHVKMLSMVWAAGVLRWGKSRKRNVICRAVEVGPSMRFRWNRRRKFDVEDPGIFHVVTTKNKEVHFVCQGGTEMAQLWVRGIKLVTMETVLG